MSSGQISWDFFSFAGVGWGQAMPYNLHLFGKAKNVLGLSEKNYSHYLASSPFNYFVTQCW